MAGDLRQPVMGHDVSVTTVAVVGLGAMGARMTRRLLDAGHEVLIWNRTPDKMRPLADLGSKLAESPAHAAHRADVVITVLSGPPALREVTEGPDGLAAGAGDSVTIIEMSTVGPAAVSQLASALPEGTNLLDAPVLGSVSEVETGSLRIFVGGPAALVERWTPLLSVLGAPIHVGPLGSGAATKLVANFTLLGALGMLGEAMALAQGLGLSRDAAFDVLAATPLAPQAERRRRAVEADEYPIRFRLTLARKDADLITEAATAAGVDLRVGAALREWFVAADEAGWGDRDYSEVLAWMLRRDTTGWPNPTS